MVSCSPSDTVFSLLRNYYCSQQLVPSVNYNLFIVSNAPHVHVPPLLSGVLVTGFEKGSIVVWHNIVQYYLSALAQTLNAAASASKVPLVEAGR